MSTARSRLFRVSLPLALVLVVSAPSADRTPTVAGDLDFSALDGSAEDLDAAADGVWTVPHSMVLEGRLTCGADGDDVNCGMRIEVRGDLIVQPGAAIEALGELHVQAAGDLTVREGAFVVARNGEVALSARGDLEIDGLVSASAGRREGAAAAKAGGHPGSVALASTGGAGKGVRVGTSGTVLSVGGRQGENRIDIAGCGIEVHGLIASVGDGPNASVTLESCEGLAVDGRDLGRGDGPRRGRIEVQVSQASAIRLTAEKAVLLDGTTLRVGGSETDGRGEISVVSEFGDLSWRHGRGSAGEAGKIHLSACRGLETAGTEFQPADAVERIEACGGQKRDEPDEPVIPERIVATTVMPSAGPSAAAPPCTPNLAVDNMTISTIEEFISCNVLTSMNTRIIPRGFVTYRALERIELGNGFSVEGSAQFKAIIDPTLNQPPTIISDGGGATAAISITENTTAVTDLDATDPEGDTEGGGGLTYSLSGDDAAKFSIDMDSGVLDFVMAPDFDMPGDLDMDNDYEVTVTVTDSVGLTDSQAITVTVTNVNELPTITSMAMQTVPENQTAVATLTATDPDVPVQTLTWTETGGADAVLLSITAGGALSFDAAPDFENPGDVGMNNVYEIDVKVDDGAGGMATQSVSVTVTDVNEAPVITSLAMQTAAENQTAVATLTATDEDLPAQTLTWSETGGADAGKLSVTAGGVLTFDVAPDFEVKADANMDGVYEIDVKVDDGAGGMATQMVKVTVTDVNENPTITSMAAQSVPENQTAVATLTATDPDMPAQVLTWTETGGADAALLSITAGGALSFDGAPDFENPGDADSDNVYEIDVKVDDGAGGMATQSVSVTVTDLNEAPVITSSAMQTAAENQTAVVTLTATDEDLPAQTLTWSETGGADAGKLSVTAGGVLTFDVAPDFEVKADANLDGVYEVDVQVSDGAGGVTPQTVLVTVTDVNEPPTITSMAAQSVPENQTAVATLTATDPDVPAQVLTWTETGGADAALLSITAGGALSFDAAPDFENPGDVGMNNVYEIDVKVDDGAGGMATQSVSVTVTNVNEAPLSGVDAFDFVGNTLLLVDKTTTNAPEIIVTTGSGNGLLDNDSDPDVPPAALSITGVFASMVDCPDMTAPFGDSPTCPTVNGGTVLVESTGEFSYTPKAGDAMATDAFGYKLSDGVNTANVTVTLTRKNRVWYVDNSTAGADNGTSTDPFDTLAEAGTSALAGDTIFVFEGDGMTTGQNAGITLKTMQRLLGEGVALTVPDTVNTVPGPTLFAAGNKSKIEHATAMNDGITVDASAADHIGIEIRGLSLSGARNAIDVTSGGTFAVGITITNNLFDDSGDEAIDLNPGGSGDFIATIEDNTFSTSSPTGNAVDVVTTAGAGDVELAINNNTDVTSSTGTGINVDGSAGGSVFVTGFADNTVHGNTGGTGVSILGATFDSDPSDADFDEVDAGTTTVGSMANPVGGSGMILGNSAAAANRVSGNLSFDQLDVFSASGTVLGAAGSAQASGGDPPTAGFEFNVTTGSLTGVKGLEFDLLTAGATFATVSSTGSLTKGIEILEVSGTVTVNGGAIAGATGTAFDVIGSNPTVTYAGTINNTAGESAKVTNTSGATVNVSGTITDTGAGYSITGNSGGTNVTFSGANSSLDTGSTTAVNLVNNTGATINFTGGGLDIDTTTGVGFGASGGGTVTVTGAGNVINTLGGKAVDLDGVTIGAADITFASLTKGAGGPNNSAVEISSVTGDTFTVTGATTVDTTAGGVDGISIVSSAATFSFASATIDNTGDAGINLSGANGTVTFTTVDIDGTGGAGIDIAGNTNAVNINGGSIGSTNDPAGNAVDVSGGAGNVTVAATIGNATARAVEVTSRTGGTVAFSAAIDEDGTGINLLSNTGGTINFSGGLTLDTGANTAFSATGGGTVNVTGTNTIGTSGTPVTGTGVDIDSTAIGAAGVTFRSIDVNGGTTGIDINGGGTSGFFTVTGIGTTDASGGTIQNTSQNGILIRNTDNISLSNLNLFNASDDGGEVASCDETVFTGCNAALEFDTVKVVDLTNLSITNFDDHGIFGQNVTDLDIANTDIDGLGADVGTNEHGIFIRNLRGAVANSQDSVFTNVVIDDAQDTAIRIQNTTGAAAPDQLTVTGSTLTDAGDSGLNAITGAVAANLNVIATANTITNTVDGVSFEAQAGDLQGTVGGATMALGNTISAGAGGDMVNGIRFFTSASVGAATINATASRNTITLDAVKVMGVAPVSGLNGIGVSAGGASSFNLGTIRATVNNNTINSSFAGIATQTVHGVITTNEGTGTTGQNVILIDDNDITLNPPPGSPPNPDPETVGVGVDGGATGAGTTVRITDNTIVATGDATNGASVGIQILPTELSDMDGTGTRVCVGVTGNDVSTPNNPFAGTFGTTELDVIAAPVRAGSFLDVESIPTGPRTTAQLKTDIEADNLPNTEVGDPGGLVLGTITGVASCPM